MGTSVVAVGGIKANQFLCISVQKFFLLCFHSDRRVGLLEVLVSFRSLPAGGAYSEALAQTPVNTLGLRTSGSGAGVLVLR